jgi:GTP pyrophosphokinase
MSEFALAEKLPDKPLKSVDDLIAKVLAYDPQAPVDIIEKAFQFSEKAHEGQIRRSGEPYIFHPLAVAGILADLRLDLETVITGLLHDTVEDTSVTLEDIKREFGDSVANLVDGVTKISKLNFKTSTQQQGENIRKMIVAMGKDVRVILVKLADRLHNMRTLNHMSYEKQARIAAETLEIYAPLASRLGLSSMKVELEDLSFRYYLPDMYYDLQQKVLARQKDHNKFIDEIKKILSEELKKAGFHKFDIQGRSKHLWSIYRKMQARNMDYSQIYDLMAFRVVVESVSECYAVLGLVHSIWKPIPGRFKDFIAMPKTNGYQSLHTTVVGNNGERIEIQIRTFDMHQVAEKGIAAHWKYKERDRKLNQQTAQQFDWIRSLLEWQKNVKNSEEFLDSVKTDLFESEIYVFTPKGDVKEFPAGSTAIDFAYSIHTDVGHHCVGAKINGKMVPLRYHLQNGDTVEVVTSPSQKPSKDWLKYCVTNRAKSKIRNYIREEQRVQALAVGKELLEREFRKYGAALSRYLSKEKEDEVASFLSDFGLPKIEDLFIRVGYGRLEPKIVVERVAPELLKTGPSKPEVKSFLTQVFDSVRKKKNNSLIRVSGMDDMLVHFARCCNPIPGDSIVGFITRGRGITVHRSDCPRAFQFDNERQIEVEWNTEATKLIDRTVKIQVISQDSPGLLKQIAEAFSAQQMNIEGAQIRTTKDLKAVSIFTVSAQSAKQVQSVIAALHKVKGVIEAKRLMGQT